MKRITFKDGNINKLIYGIFKNISKKRKFQLLTLLIVMLFSALSELFSLAAVVPFMTVLTNPDLIYDIKLFNKIFYFFEITNDQQLLKIFTLLFLFLVSIAAFIRILNVWFNVKMTGKIASDLSCSAYKKILEKPYSFHLENNSSNFIPSITTSINHTVFILNYFLSFCTSIFVTFAIVIVLLYTNWRVAFLVGTLFTGSYFLISILIKGRLKRNSKRISSSMKGQMKALNEGIGSVRNVILDGTQSFYQAIYKKSDLPLRMNEAESTFWGSAPRFILEFLGVSFIVCLAYFYSLNNEDNVKLFALLGTFALGGQRLILSLQTAFFSWTGINTYSESVLNVLDLLSKSDNYCNVYSSKKVSYKLKDSIKFNNVSFAYGDKTPFILKDLTLEFFKGQRIGIVGKTGIGKSTIVDLIMGLNFPKEGEILIDGKNLHDLSNPEFLQQWRRSISHVPQDIFLTDNSFEENIAIGVPPEDIDFNMVKIASKKAQIDNFIEKSKYGYKTKIGERGVQLSGGQRQRLGIARAFYKKCNILILDEATSALDKITEEKVLKSIENFDDNITIFIIAHRLNNIAKCSKIIHFENNQISIRDNNH